LHLSLLSGLLGNIGFKPDHDEAYLGARGIRFYPHPGNRLKKKPGRWVVCAELVETSRLFGRGVAQLDPTWLEQVSEHLLRRQMLDPHWDKRSGDVLAMERATLYGLVVYSGRRKPYARVDEAGARQIFIREALVDGQLDGDWPFLRANQRLLAQVEALEHKSRRQDVLVDDAIIEAFYEANLPAEVNSRRSLQQWFEKARAAQPELLCMGREDLMRHSAQGVTAQAFPNALRLGGVDCRAEYLHAPGDVRDGITVSVPLFVLNQVSEERTEWLVPGMLKDKIQALLKSLPQKPRSRFVPLPEAAAKLALAMGEIEAFGMGSLTDALLARVRAQTSLDVKRADFKLDMLSPHFFMNLRVVDEHGRQSVLFMNPDGRTAKAQFNWVEFTNYFEFLSSNSSDIHQEDIEKGNDTTENEGIGVIPLIVRSVVLFLFFFASRVINQLIMRCAHYFQLNDQVKRMRFLWIQNISRGVAPDPKLKKKTQK
jgi:ATP-dependent helicase HrpA